MAIYQIELTNHCNAQCEWCGNTGMSRKRGFMALEVFIGTLDYLQVEPPPGNTVGLHHFGESLLHPDLDSFLLLLQKKRDTMAPQYQRAFY
jgi:MoaA/NifB/PqqE/SkfB family radical SAM enzyme